MTPISRRRLLQGTAAGAAALGFSSTTLAAGPKRRSPSEEIRCAVIGVRGRGRSHIRGLHGLPNVRVVALCDADEKVLAREVQELAAQSENGEKVDAYVDMRHVMDREDVDVIATATPNHWHALCAVWACQAGKDVYLEKPVSHNLWEGRQIVAAARKYGRIVQAGTQSRSSQAIAQAVQWLQAGNLGAIELARGLCYKARKSIGKVDGPQDVPDHVDYDLWCGPAPDKRLRRANLHYDWHWVFDTGNGDLGNQGIHQMDLCRWALGEEGLAPAAFSIGGRFGYDDDGNTPNTQIVYHAYERAPLVFEVRGLPKDKATWADWNNGTMDRYMGLGIGAVIHCEGGYLLLPDYHRAIAYDTEGAEIQRWEGASDHFENFIQAVRSRDAAELNSDIQEGHVSSALCHVGNVSHLLGQRRDPDEAREAIGAHDALAECYDRFRHHLEQNEVDLEARRPVVGKWLELDVDEEVFIADEEANRLRKRRYRDPYVVPERV